ncbi:MAG TPA: hypothetical protein VIF64_02695 [Pyrinomonadaceae bacterium]|jgi:hypothetical protein
MRFAGKHIRFTAIVVVAIFGSACQTRPAGPGNTNAASPLVVATATPAQSPLSPDIPGDADFSDLPDKPTIGQIQHDFDVFSWKSFVALNWSPDRSQIIGSSADGDNPTVWGTYIESYEVFLPDGKAPSWDSREVPPICQPTADASKGNLPVFRMTMKVSDQVLNFSQQAFGTGPLIDQRGEYVRYSINLNQDAFNYILNNKLYSKEGQRNFTNVNFPIAATPSPTPASSSANSPATVGSIVLKSAWRILDPTQGDVVSRYHKIDAYVYTPAAANPPTKASCERKTLGLVGLHIAHKTASAPQWVWSTFEQVDNVAVGPNAPAGLKPSFFNPDCKNCRINKPPPKPWNPNVKTTPSQITRILPIDDATNKLNAEWQGLLAGVNKNSVWQYYQLVSTQWPANPSRSPTGDPAPQFLANAAIETYIQGKVPNVSSSCIACHNNATTTTSAFADFSYLLERAQGNSSKEANK